MHNFIGGVNFRFGYTGSVDALGEFARLLGTLRKRPRKKKQSVERNKVDPRKRKRLRQNSPGLRSKERKKRKENGKNSKVSPRKRSAGRKKRRKPAGVTEEENVRGSGRE